MTREEMMAAGLVPEETKHNGHRRAHFHDYSRPGVYMITKDRVKELMERKYPEEDAKDYELIALKAACLEERQKLKDSDRRLV